MINARDIVMRQAIDYDVQYVIPHFQRKYQWTEDEWADLWNDLEDAYRRVRQGEAYHHFLGSIVTIPVNEGQQIGQIVQRRILIDGQQRLTTTTILIKALADFARTFEQLPPDLFESCYRNRGDDPDFRQKILPGRFDSPGYSSLMNDENTPTGDLIHDAYRYFNHRIREFCAGDERAADHLVGLGNTLRDRLQLVSIELDGQENSYAIFETLNTRGLPLLDSDKLRNLLFMYIAPMGHAFVENVYDEHWHPMEIEINGDDSVDNLGNNLDRFLLAFDRRQRGSVEGGSEFAWRFRDVILHRMATGRAENSPDNLAQYAWEVMQEIQVSGKAYRLLAWPETDTDPGQETICLQIAWMRRVGVGTTSDPLLMELIERYLRCSEPRPADTLIRALRMVESYYVRKRIAGREEKANNRVCASLAADLHRMDHNLPLDQVADQLYQGLDQQSPGTVDEFPDDQLVREGITSTSVCHGPRKKSIARAIFAGMEDLSSADRIMLLDGDATLEHILPMKLTPEWSEHLGEGADHIRRSFQNTLCNLTLLEGHLNYGQGLITEKHAQFGKSRFARTRQLCTYQAWREDDMKRRADLLLEAINQKWPR